jgi:hypothetical protein
MQSWVSQKLGSLPEGNGGLGALGAGPDWELELEPTSWLAAYATAWFSSYLSTDA